jgi:hypothetical protein
MSPTTVSTKPAHSRHQLTSFDPPLITAIRSTIGENSPELSPKLISTSLIISNPIPSRVVNGRVIIRGSKGVSAREGGNRLEGVNVGRDAAWFRVTGWEWDEGFVRVFSGLEGREDMEVVAEKISFWEVVGIRWVAISPLEREEDDEYGLDDASREEDCVGQTLSGWRGRTGDDGGGARFVLIGTGLGLMTSLDGVEVIVDLVLAAETIRFAPNGSTNMEVVFGTFERVGRCSMDLAVTSFLTFSTGPLGMICVLPVLVIPERARLAGAVIAIVGVRRVVDGLRRSIVLVLGLRERGG